ncbi:MAG: ABC transporter permease [Bacteroidetes bacterium]|nr:ABC transporter permease [Bacteroidota bacterium]
MQLSAFLARRMALSSGRQLSRLTVLMATGSIALGIAVMLISVSVVGGFRQEIVHKLAGFSGDIRITGYMASADDSLHALLRTDSLVAALPARFPQITHIHPYLEKDAILKSPAGLEGIRAYGVDAGWDSTFFAEALQEGRLPCFPAGGYGTEVVISRKQAQRLQTRVGEPLRIFFEQSEKIRSRKVTVTGIYETGMAELDQAVVVCHLGLLQRIMGLAPAQVQGFQVRLAAGTDAPALAEQLSPAIAYNQQAQALQVLFAELFQWLDLQNLNVAIIIGLMVFVSVLNMSAAVVILVTERTGTIGLLKALGATGRQVQGVFLRAAGRLLLRGMVLGNGMALLLLLIQQQTGWLTLDSESYFVKAVPVSWPWLSWLLLNLATAAVTLLAMLLPVRVVNGVRIVRALRFR